MNHPVFRCVLTRVYVSTGLGQGLHGTGLGNLHFSVSHRLARTYENFNDRSPIELEERK
jgi:hypothetical protein